MKKQFFLFLALLVFSFHYCGDNLLIYKNELKEIKINTVIIQKKYNHKVYDLKVSVGEGFLGKVTSFSVEVLGDDQSFEKILSANKENIKTNLLQIISSVSSGRGGKGSGVFTVGNCVSVCTQKWHCSDKPTETGALLCGLDCALECMGA